MNVVYRETSLEEFCVKESKEMSQWRMEHGDKDVFYLIFLKDTRACLHADRMSQERLLVQGSGDNFLSYVFQ